MMLSENIELKLNIWNNVLGLSSVVIYDYLNILG